MFVAWLPRLGYCLIMRSIQHQQPGQSRVVQSPRDVIRGPDAGRLVTRRVVRGPEYPAARPKVK